MAKYNFRLQKVLKIKKLQQDIQEQKLAASKKHLVEQRVHLEELQERERKFLEEFKQKHLSSKRGHVLHRYSSYQRQVEKYVEQQNQQVVQASEMVEEDRTQLLQAAQETNIIDKLKERYYNQFLKKRDTEEQKRVDEMSQLKPFRKND